MSESYDVVVVGGGPAGVSAALRACELGARVALVEMQRLGGTCTNDGCAPTRVLAHAARLSRDARQLSDYGIAGSVEPVDFAQLLARTQDMIYRLQEKKQLLGHLHAAGAHTCIADGPARFVDAHALRCADGSRLQGSYFILCPGGRARRLPFPGSELTLTHSDIWSLTRLPRSVAIVGGAATGCQLASVLAAFGARTTLLERMPQLLSSEDVLVQETVAAAFRARGIDVICGIGGVERIESAAPGGERVLHYRVEGAARALNVEAVIQAVGWTGNVESLNLEAAGVRYEHGYIEVDEQLRSSAAHIFAAGDVIGGLMLAQTATEEGRMAAENALLGTAQGPAHRIVPHGGFTDPEYGGVGLTEAQARASQECAVAQVPYAELDRAVIDGRTEGAFKLIASGVTHRVLGAHAAGEQALETIQIVSAGMAAGMSVEQFAGLELAYPTYAAIIGLAARQIARALGGVTIAPHWRALGRDRGAEWERSEP